MPTTGSLAPEFVEADFAGRTLQATLPDSARRVSHYDLMAAAESLGFARDKEAAAGNDKRAREINQLVLMCFMAAIRVGEIDLPEAQS